MSVLRKENMTLKGMGAGAQGKKTNYGTGKDKSKGSKGRLASP